MTGYDVQRYETCLEKAHHLGMKLKPRGGGFDLTDKYTSTILPTIDAVFYFILGIEYGKEKT